MIFGYEPTRDKELFRICRALEMPLICRFYVFQIQGSSLFIRAARYLPR
jgi:hypothetical protein